MKPLLARLLGLVVVLVLVTASVPAPVRAASAVTASVAADGGWAAFNFPYAGDLTDITINLSYTPADPFTDQGIILEVYAPDAPPPGNSPIAIGVAGKAPGQKTWAFASDKGGSYTVVVHNWDYNNRTVSLSLSVVNTGTGDSLPGLALVAPPPAPPATLPALRGTTVTTDVPAGGGWAAFSFNYPGDRTDVTIKLSYTPADPFTDQGVLLKLFEPGAPDNLPTATGLAGPAPGQKVWAFASNKPGAYTVVVHNWDFNNRSVSATLTTVKTDTGNPGPELTLVGSSTANPTPVQPAAPIVSGTTLSTALNAGGAWIAYSLSYPGDFTDVTVKLSYAPADPLTDAAVFLRAYAPDARPPDSEPTAIGRAGPAPGQKIWAFASDRAGNYTVFIQNWDVDNRQISLTLTTFRTDTGEPGPLLTQISRGG